MKHIFIILFLLGTTLAHAQMRPVLRDTVDYSVRTSSDTIRNTWPTALTVRWLGATTPDTLIVRAIPDGDGSIPLPVYDPLRDSIDSLIVRSAPIQTFYLYSRKRTQLFVQHPEGILKDSSTVVLTFE